MPETRPSLLADAPFPPPFIARWVDRKGVMTCALVQELRAWADHMARDQACDEMHRDDCRCFEKGSSPDSDAS